MQQIQISKTLNVEAVERELSELWKQTAGDTHSAEEALLRSRVVNLAIFIPSESGLTEVHEVLAELSAIHPCRALIMVGERDAPDRDIELYISALCQTGKQSRSKQLCCEEVTLTARGQFISELASAAIPLLVEDLPVFLWWRDDLRVNDESFIKLNRAADRMVFDSAEFSDPDCELPRLAQLFDSEEHETLAISDINWARLTSWRALLASFYDIQSYRAELDSIVQVRIDYVPPQSKPEEIAPQALLIAGWLASRLAWSLAREQPAQKIADKLFFNFRKGGQPIKLQLNRTERSEIKPGRLVEVELISKRQEAASFLASRSGDGLYLKTQASLGSGIHPGRVLPVRNRSTAQLLGREIEILSNDSIYEDAIRLAAAMIEAEAKLSNP